MKQWNKIDLIWNSHEQQIGCIEAESHGDGPRLRRRRLDSLEFHAGSCDFCLIMRDNRTKKGATPMSSP